MVSVPVQCPYCHSTAVIKAGKQANGAQRYQCQNAQCARRIFLLQYQDRGRALEVRRQVVAMAIGILIELWIIIAWRRRRAEARFRRDRQ